MKQIVETTPREYSREPQKANLENRVTPRAFFLGLAMSVALASLCVWIETVANVHFLGGVQMPFGAIFGLMLAIFVVNLPLRKLASTRGALRPFSPTELLTVYAMLMFSALASTPGTDNFFIATGPTLFYYSKPENGWAELFYQHIPSYFAPGWDGKTYQREVIEKFYTGSVALADVPWHAWTSMLLAWGIFLVLVYSALFFLSLLLRRQWIESEALAFPLVQLPLQMVETDGANAHPPARAFWSNRLMWAGFTLALCVHFVRGMPTYFPDWPALNGFQGNEVTFAFPDKPWSAMGPVRVSFFFGAIGIAYLLTREVSLSFWVFFLLQNYAKVLSEQFGFPVDAMPKSSYGNQPLFLTFQSFGGWLMMAAILLWTARRHLSGLFRQAIGRNETLPGDPFSPRFAVFGFALSICGLLAWSSFAGISLFASMLFFGLYVLLALVLARVVIEGGFLFPQITFSPLEMMTTGITGTAALGASTLTKLSFVQPSLMSDMRTNLLPAFLHTLKIGHEMKLERAQLRRLMLCAACAVFTTMLVTMFLSIIVVYANGGLTGYTWFTSGTQGVFTSAAGTLKTQPNVDALNVFFMLIGGASVLLLTVLRARFLWFPLHPLGYIVATGYPITRLWASFFLGWAIKTLILRFGGGDSVTRFRPFMIGLILGNVVAIVLWLIFGFFWSGTYIGYWTA